MSDTTILKVVVLGDSGVGKTALRNQFIHRQFVQSYKATIGADFVTKSVHVESLSKTVSLQIWDTAGQERFHSLGVAFFRGADACILVYDTTNTSSLDHLETWMRDFLRQAGISNPAEFPFIVVGNKIDLTADRTVTAEKAAIKAQELRQICNEIARYETDGSLSDSGFLSSTPVQSKPSPLQLRETRAMGPRRMFGLPPPREPAPLRGDVTKALPVFMAEEFEGSYKPLTASRQSTTPVTSSLQSQADYLPADRTQDSQYKHHRLTNISSMTVESCTSFHTALSDFDTSAPSQLQELTTAAESNARNSFTTNTSPRISMVKRSNSTGSSHKHGRSRSFGIWGIGTHLWQKLNPHQDQHLPREKTTRTNTAGNSVSMSDIELSLTTVAETRESRPQTESCVDNTESSEHADLNLHDLAHNTSDTHIKQAPLVPFPYFEVSAKSGTHVSDPFIYIATHTLHPRLDFELDTDSIVLDWRQPSRVRRGCNC
ncbi:GTPase activity protein [Batrachochytrium dendrobatidis]|nr:GTPase [Batrachochytrium dendrobatidis]KAK5668265.1 GTPase activity protein [Batrachochytrium dendrobatidis]